MTLAVTVVLFGFALVEKGLTRDLLLEAGVFLVSLKLVLSAAKTHAMLKSIEDKLDSLSSPTK